MLLIQFRFNFWERYAKYKGETVSNNQQQIYFTLHIA